MKKQYISKSITAAFVIILLLAAAIPALGASAKTRVFVTFAPGQKGNVEKALSAAGAEFHYTFDDLSSFVVTVPSQALQGLSKNPNIVDIEEDALRFPISITASETPAASLMDAVVDGAQTVPWGVEAVQALDVWDANSDGSVDTGANAGDGVTVCIIDTGFYSAQEDLAGIDLVGGMSQVDTDPFSDGAGHGSHVAGTIAAQDNNFGVIGVAPNVSVYIVKYFNNDGVATYASDLIAAGNECAANGADIISMSLGGARPTRKEETAFNTLYANGILSIAAAGNEGTTAYEYPGSYASVMSVAAVDESLTIADFSQQNDQVEIAGPGVAVLSTVPFVDVNNLTVAGVDYQSNHIEYSGRGAASGALVDGGLCTSTGAWSGMVVLCERGDISFYDKVMNVQNSGGAAAVIYNNEPGNFLGTLGDGASSSIIGVSISQEDGQYLVASQLGTVATVTSNFYWPESGYEAWDGTSMATPHVSAVAALVWSAVPSASNADIRDALNSTALDLGAAGRDVAYGYGLVQAAAAIDYLGGVTPPPDDAFPTVSITAPASGSSYTVGDSITFTATAADAEDGDLSSSIAWTSSLDGALGTGASVSAVLSVGTHTITASATDSANQTSTDSITVTVSDGGTGGSLVVSVATDKSVYGDRELVTITVTVTDGSAPVAGASVSGTVTTANGGTKTFSGLTSTSGTVTASFKSFIRKDGAGTYTVDASASLSGYTDGSGSTTFLVQ